MKRTLLTLSGTLLLALTLTACQTTSMDTMAKKEGKPVGITPGMMSADFMMDGKPESISRSQDNDSVVDEKFVKTSRPCPPFCIQPAVLAPGVETIAELEVIHYIQAMHNGEPVIVQDSRTPDWHARGHIPGTVSIPWTSLATKAGATIIDISEIMVDQFGVIENEGVFDFSDAKTLVLYCNGMWCGQSPASIKTLLGFGYPAHKIKWYRGGMQSWSNLGLTTVL
jgi:rhodanese-related sulfurtransferase